MEFPFNQRSLQLNFLYLARPSTCSILPALHQRFMTIRIESGEEDCLLRLCFLLWWSVAAFAERRSRESKSFRFLQIISAANKQYAGVRAPDRQQRSEVAERYLYCSLVADIIRVCPPLLSSPPKGGRGRVCRYPPRPLLLRRAARPCGS